MSEHIDGSGGDQLGMSDIFDGIIIQQHRFGETVHQKLTDLTTYNLCKGTMKNIKRG